MTNKAKTFQTSGKEMKVGHQIQIYSLELLQDFPDFNLLQTFEKKSWKLESYFLHIPVVFLGLSRRAVLKNVGEKKEKRLHAA